MDRVRGPVLPLLLFTVAAAVLGRQGSNEIYLAGFFPTSFNLSEGAIGRGVIPAVKLALQHINSNDRVLANYTLHIFWNNTECDAAMGMKSFFDMVAEKPYKLMLFGAACTAVTDPIAKASQFFHLVQLTYADTHPMYTSENYPNFFRVVPSEASFNPARVALLQHFNWSRVGTLYQSSPRYALPHTKLLTDLDLASIKIGAAELINDELQDELDKLKDNDVRIILGSFDEEWARKIFCQAYKQGMYGRKYQWIIVGMYQERWWETPSDDVSCDPEELSQALEGYISTDLLPLSTAPEVTVSGLTPTAYEGEYDLERQGEYSRFHGYAYDGIWALALAVQTVLKKLSILGISWTLNDFRYRDPFWGRLFREALDETYFIGVTGVVNFVRNERRGLVLLKQFQNGEEVKVGEYDVTQGELDLSKGKPILWRGGSGPPMDRTLSVKKRTRISVTVYSILVISAILGIILAFVFLVVNIRFRNQRYIKMSSPYLNNLIIMGCILTYTSIILLGLDSGLTSERSFPYICAARAWTLMSGFTLAFGSMFSKTWRVHAIFTNIKLNKKVIKDYKLFMVVGVLVMIDVVILTTWQIVDPFYRETRNGTPLASEENEDLEIIPQMEFCQSKKMTIFLGCIYAYKGLLMAFGCFLAWETRSVSIPALNDSKYVGMSVYNVVIMCSTGAAISFVLRDQQDAAFVIISIFIIFCSTTTLCLVFVPKLVELRRNPQAGDKRVRATLKPLKQSRRQSEDLSLYGRIKLLQDENIRYRQKLEEKHVELQALIIKLREIREPVIVISHDVTAPIPEVTSPTPENSTEREEASSEEKEGAHCLDLLEIKPISRRRPTSLNCSRKGSSGGTTPSGPSPDYFLLPPEPCSRKMSSASADIPPRAKKKTVRIRTEASCPDLVSPSITSRSEGSHNGPVTPKKRCLSFLDEASLAAKFVDSTDSGSESDNSQKSFLRKRKFCGDGPQQIQAQESDDTSYARAIKSYQNRREAVNGLSSSCDEDTDRCDPGTVSEESDSSRPGHRRAKSMGALLSAGGSPNEDPRSSATGAGVSVIESRRGDTTFFPFPLFSPVMGGYTQSGFRTGNQGDGGASAVLYSSFPSIKCDIVEYL